MNHGGHHPSIHTYPHPHPPQPAEKKNLRLGQLCCTHPPLLLPFLLGLPLPAIGRPRGLGVQLRAEGRLGCSGSLCLGGLGILARLQRGSTDFFSGQLNMHQRVTENVRRSARGSGTSYSLQAHATAREVGYRRGHKLQPTGTCYSQGGQL